MLFNDDLTNSLTCDLLTSAKIYLAMGWSVIPTLGKVAVIPWSSFQTRPPTPEQIKQWFQEGAYTDLAIITGPVSQLAVLDFDDPLLHQIFAREFPHLSETFTVQTKRGHHLYYHILPQLRLTNRSVKGVDLQYTGKYVVAPPSIVADHEYRVIRGGLPKTLSNPDLAAITGFLDQQAESSSATLTSIGTPDSLNRAAEGRSAPQRCDSCSIQPSDLAALYRASDTSAGRNTRLFQLACLGRDNGLTPDQVIKALADLHRYRQAHQAHKPETHRQRYREAVRTIQSAFSKPARNSLHRYWEPEQLPNLVREALFEQKLTCVVRVIEGLRLKGVQPGQAFTKKKAVALLTGIVGRDSVYNALNAVLEGGRSPLPRTPSPTTYGVARATVPRQNSKCLEFNLSKPGKIPKAGRPPDYFVMPSNLELAEKLGVRRSNISDTLTPDDLKSAKATRTACHTGLIKRKPGQYSIRFFAKRLGMSERTIYRYNAEDDHIHAEPIYYDQPVFWHNLEAVIPPDPSYFPHEGVCLVASGKNYPPKRPVARKLLATGHLVTLRTRVANFWWYGDKDKPMPLRFQADYYAILEQMDQAARRRRQPSKPQYQFLVITPQRVARISPGASETPKPSVTTIPFGRKPDGRTSYRQPLPDLVAEVTAQHVHRAIHEMSKGKQGNISLASARRLVYRYGEPAVRQALQTTACRRNIRKPVGFISTLLRSQSGTGPNSRETRYLLLRRRHQ